MRLWNGTYCLLQHRAQQSVHPKGMVRSEGGVGGEGLVKPLVLYTKLKLRCRKPGM